MGAGRKTSTYDIDTRAMAFQGFEAMQRKLGEEKLGGCIFGCTNDTQEECLTDLVFGLPRSHWLYVQNISTGMPIFLYNYNSKKLHGIFKAASDGQLDIKPDGWCKGTGSRTQYPAQVKVEIYADCESLSDRDYRPILKDCYLDDGSGKFIFELKKTEAQALCRAFDEKTKRTPAQSTSSQSYPGAASKVVKERPVFRPASPPAIPAWGGVNTGKSSAQEAPKPNEFPSLSTTSSGPLPSKPSRPTSTTSTEGDSVAKPNTFERKEEVSWPAQNPTQAPAQQEPPPKKESLPPEKGYTSSQSAAPQKQANMVPKTDPPRSSNSNGGLDEASQPKRPSTTGQAEDNSPAKQQKVASPSPHTSANNLDSQANAPSSQTSAQPNGSASHVDQQSNFEKDVAAMRKALNKIDPLASDKLLSVVMSLKSQLDTATRERVLIAKQAEMLMSENLELQKIAEKQLHAIEVFKEESAALRSDLAFVGKQTNVTVTPENPSVTAIEIPEFTARSPRTHSLISSISNQKVGALTDGYGASSPAPKFESLLIFGGNNSKSWLTNVDQFTPSDSNWGQRSQMPEPRGYGAAASAGESVYLMGGGTGKKWYNSVLRYDVHEEAWFAMAAMEEQRGSLGAASINGKIYAVGGGKPGYQSETVEILDPELNSWMLGKRMKSKRFAINAGVVENALHVIGGFCEGAYLATGERLDPREGFWQDLPDMIHRRGGHAVVAVGTDLYALGGWNNDQFMPEVEVYDARKNAWRAFASLKTPHAYFSAAHLDGKLYVLGGMVDQQNFNDLVEYYDESTEKWKAVHLNETDDALGRKRAFIASCKMPESS